MPLAIPKLVTVHSSSEAIIGDSWPGPALLWILMTTILVLASAPWAGIGVVL